MGKVMVTAGEVSGDIHASRVVREISRIAPATQFFGMGSEALRKEGVRIISDPTGISTIGFMEAFRNLKLHRANLQLLKEAITAEKPDVLFLVDNSGFNMLMARAGRRAGIPVVNYFSPSAWVWGRWRARWMARNQATIAAVFPMEAEVYRLAGAEVEFVGHPLVDLVQVEESREEVRDWLELDSDYPIIGLLPGSRRQEIDTLFPEMLETAVKLQQENRGCQFVLPLAPGVSKERLTGMAAERNLVLKIVENATYRVMKAATLLIAASGTATLEAAILGTPMIIVYRTGWSTYQLGRRLLQLEHIGLPNIIAGREIVPELLQEEARADRIYRETKRLLDSPAVLRGMSFELLQVKTRLGSPGAVKRTAELVLKKGGLL